MRPQLPIHWLPSGKAPLFHRSNQGSFLSCIADGKGPVCVSIRAPKKRAKKMIDLNFVNQTTGG